MWNANLACKLSGRRSIHANVQYQLYHIITSIKYCLVNYNIIISSIYLSFML